MSTESASDFASDTAVAPLGGARYRGRAPGAWFGPIAPNGGFLAALVLRAITAELDAADREPRSLTVHFLRPPAEGELDVALQVERTGRTASTVSARVEQGGRLVAIVLCTFTQRYEGAAEWAPPVPEVPPPPEVAVAGMEGAPRMFGQMELRPLYGGQAFAGAGFDDAVVGGWLRPRVAHPIDHPLLAFLSDAWWPSAFSRLEKPSPAPTLDLTIHFRGVLPQGEHEYVLGRYESRAAIAGVFEEDGELWSEDGRLLAQSRQIALVL